MAPITRSNSRNRRSQANNVDPMSQPGCSRATESSSRDSHSTRNQNGTFQGLASSQSTSRRHQNSLFSQSASGVQRVSKHFTRSSARSSTSVQESLNSALDPSTSRASSFSRIETRASTNQHMNGLVSDSESLDTMFTVNLADLNFPDDERISQGDSKYIFDQLCVIRERLGFINTRLDNFLEKYKMLFISRNPCVCMGECKQEDINVANYNTSRLVCSVCYCDLLKPDVSVVSTVCGHIYCHDCLVQVMFMKDSKCPNCRKPLNRWDYHQIYLPQLLD